jgi:Protein of unknown function (DUF3775)
VGGQRLRALMPEKGARRVRQGSGRGTQGGSEASEVRPELTISLEKVCFAIAKARDLDVKVAPEELDDASDEDIMQRILEDYADDPTLEELRSFLLEQNDDELKELLALAWLGRGDFAIEEWRDGLRRVGDVRQFHTADYLLGTPLLADFLEEGLAQFGLSCEEFELGRM